MQSVSNWRRQYRLTPTPASIWPIDLFDRQSLDCRQSKTRVTRLTIDGQNYVNYRFKQLQQAPIPRSERLFGPSASSLNTGHVRLCICSTALIRLAIWLFTDVSVPALIRLAIYWEGLFLIFLNIDGTNILQQIQSSAPAKGCSPIIITGENWAELHECSNLGVKMNQFFEIDITIMTAVPCPSWYRCVVHIGWMKLICGAPPTHYHTIVIVLIDDADWLCWLVLLIDCTDHAD